MGTIGKSRPLEERLDKFKNLLDRMTVGEMLMSWRSHDSRIKDIFEKVNKISDSGKELTSLEKEEYDNEIEYSNAVLSMIVERVNEWKNAYRSSKEEE